MGKRIILAGILLCAACAPSADEARAPEQAEKVKTTGKEPTDLKTVPAEVLAAARAAQPDMSFTEAEAETRDGRNYYDVAGRLPDGSEIELDLLQEPSGWTVVETQRDIGFEAAPEPVRAASAKADASFKPARVIESRQNDGIVIYELFGPAPAGGEGRKVEIKYDGRKAELLTKEWAH
jgi:hypothetical protein